ncbi:MAG: aspartate/glutamate racemase family protein [Alphaproteobacteria bacterium]|nr:aspartate/glutamate racemase family protein [Alphaproteobacteria bacterium]
MNDLPLSPPKEPLVNRKHMPFALDDGLGPRARIGLVVLATDNTMEHEWRHVMGGLPGIAFYESRIYNSPEITPETLAEMEKDIEAATRLILPNGRMDVVAFGCTSGTIVIGEETVFQKIRNARPGVACTTPITAGIAGMKKLGAKRIALLTPYVDQINQMMRGFIEARGIEVPVVGSFNNSDDAQVARMTPGCVRDAAIKLGRHPAVDGVFVSCTSLRVAEIVEEVEAAIGKPASSSNHAMAWHALRLAGVNDALAGRGRLFRA